MPALSGNPSKIMALFHWAAKEKKVRIKSAKEKIMTDVPGRRD